MSHQHETFLETAEKKALEGYVTALTHVRDGIEHADSKVIGEVQRWIEDAEAKLTTLTEEEAAAAATAGKPGAGGASSGNPSAAATASEKPADEGDVTDVASATGKATDPGAAGATTSAKGNQKAA